MAILKAKIKAINISIPNKNIVRFICKAEFKYKNRNKKWEGKINEFFEAFNLIRDTGEKNFVNYDFLSDNEDEDSHLDED